MAGMGSERWPASRRNGGRHQIGTLADIASESAQRPRSGFVRLTWFGARSLSAPQLDELTLFKAGINIFYPSAHRTRHHDRRCPGGLLISVNSPGHWANSLVKHGYAPTLSAAVDRAMDTALRSIGNGGMGEVPGPGERIVENVR